MQVFEGSCQIKRGVQRDIKDGMLNSWKVLRVKVTRSNDLVIRGQEDDKRRHFFSYKFLKLSRKHSHCKPVILESESCCG